MLDSAGVHVTMTRLDFGTHRCMGFVDCVLFYLLGTASNKKVCFVLVCYGASFAMSIHTNTCTQHRRKAQNDFR